MNQALTPTLIQKKIDKIFSSTFTVSQADDYQLIIGVQV